MLMIRRRCSDTEVARARLPGGGGQRNAGGLRRSPPQHALPLVGCAALVHPTLPRGRKHDQGARRIADPMV
jgi:hypothetical protein